MLVRVAVLFILSNTLFFDQGGAETFSAHIGVPVIKADA